MLETVQSQPQMKNLLSHKVRHDYVLLLPIEFDSGDTVVQAKSQEDKPEWGLVISIGEGRILESGERVPISLKENDVVLFMAYGGTTIRSLGQDFVYVRQEDVISVYE